MLWTQLSLRCVLYVVLWKYVMHYILELHAVFQGDQLEPVVRFRVQSLGNSSAWFGRDGMKLKTACWERWGVFSPVIACRANWTYLPFRLLLPGQLEICKSQIGLRPCRANPCSVGSVCSSRLNRMMSHSCTRLCMHFQSHRGCALNPMGICVSCWIHNCGSQRTHDPPVYELAHPSCSLVKVINHLYFGAWQEGSQKRFLPCHAAGIFLPFHGFQRSSDKSNWEICSLTSWGFSKSSNILCYNRTCCPQIQ